MASEIGEKEEQTVLRDDNCSETFSQLHLNADDEEEISKKWDAIESHREKLVEQIDHPERQIFIEQINRWEENSIQMIQQTAQECREEVFQETKKYFHQIKFKLDQLIDQIKVVRREHTANQIDYNQIKEKLTQLETDLVRVPTISIETDLSSFIRKISVIVTSDNLSFLSSTIDLTTKWKQNGSTVFGKVDRGCESNQVSCPCGICVDDDEQCIYVTDSLAHKILQWNYGAKMIRAVLDGCSSIQIINQPTDVAVHQLTDSLIICDWGNKRVVQWLRRNTTIVRPLIYDIDCWGVAIDSNGHLYVSDSKKHEIRRRELGQPIGVLVAGGNGQGDGLNQLNNPTHLVVDNEFSVYISDNYNHRVVKWKKDAKEGIIVAGGNGSGNSLTQLFYPQGVMLDHMGNIYVADSGNNRVVRWLKGSTEGQIIVGGNGKGRESNQFSGVDGLSFDRQGNIYAVDWNNNRVQKFEIASN